MASNNDQNFTPGQGASQPPIDLQSAIEQFWQQASEEITKLGHSDFKVQDLPLARIKKIMKLDEDVKMISAEAPVLFAKAAEIFIRELSLRAWIHTEDNKRRTLQRNDIATAISKFDQFDFLIDIVPRDELKPSKREEGVQRTSMLPDQVQYYFQLAQQHQAALQQNQQQTQPQQTQSVPAPAPQVIQQVQLGSATQQSTVSVTETAPQVIQIQPPQPQPQQVQVTQPAQQQQQAQTTQVFMQIVGANGEVQNVPVQLPASQLQSIQQQLHGKQAGQPIIIQTGSQGGQEQTDNSQFNNTQSMYQVPQQTVQQVFVQQAVTGDGDHSEVVHESAG